MKKQILTIAAVLALVFAGAVFAQGENTTAPGPTTQQEPGLTNNNLPNPGNPVKLGNQTPPVEEHGTVEGTATESLNQEPAPAPETTSAPSATATESTSSTGTYSGSADSATATATADSSTLPSTASDLPTVALIGLLAVGAAFVLRYSRRNA